MSNHPTEDNPEDGPDCPDCSATTETWEHVLNEETNERTVVIDCPDCGFELETESNLVHQDRLDRLGEATEADLGSGDI